MRSVKIPSLKPEEKVSVILETLHMVNVAVSNDANSLTSTFKGQVDPDRAYLEIVQKLVEQL
jgi:hypothetical protein